MEPLEDRLALDGRVVITELVASNDQGLEDEDGDQSDWIELFNDGDQAVNLGGWYLTDDARNLGQMAASRQGAWSARVSGGLCLVQGSSRSDAKSAHEFQPASGW